MTYEPDEDITRAVEVALEKQANQKKREEYRAKNDDYKKKVEELGLKEGDEEYRIIRAFAIVEDYESCDKKLAEIAQKKQEEINRKADQLLKEKGHYLSSPEEKAEQEQADKEAKKADLYGRYANNQISRAEFEKGMKDIGGRR